MFPFCSFTKLTPLRSMAFESEQSESVSFCLGKAFCFLNRVSPADFSQIDLLVSKSSKPVLSRTA